VTGLPDVHRSRAVFIGASRYQLLGQLGAVHNNLSALSEALQDERVLGLPSGNCVVVEDPASATEALDPITEAAREATDTLLLYYAGHGLIDPWRGELHLTHVWSDPQRMYTAIQYSQVRDLLLDSRATCRIVILDCCYSGRALGQMGNTAETIVTEASAEGTYVLAAVAENKAAIAPPGQQFTAFTGELLHIIERGINGHGPLLDLDSIYRELLAVMRARGLPTPQKRDRNTAGQLTLIRNQAYRTADIPTTTAITAGPSPKDGTSDKLPQRTNKEVLTALEAHMAASAAPAPAAAEEMEPGSAVPSIERALREPSRDRNLTWHGKVKIVTGTGQGPGKRDQQALDRARAKLPLKTPQRVLMLGCTSGAGQSVTTLMTGQILASLREEPVAAVDLHDGTLARYSAPSAWLEDVLSGKPPRGAIKAHADGLLPTSKTVPARLDVIASRDPLSDGDELKLSAELTRHYRLAMLDPGPAGLKKLLKITDQLIIVVPASIDGAGALTETKDWLDTHGFAELSARSMTVINGVSRRSLPDVERAESVARGRCRAIVRVPWDDMLPVEVADPSALRPQTRVAYTALAGVLVAGLAATSVKLDSGN
jgi:hypothetical protein